MLFRSRSSFDQRLLESRLTVTPDPAEIRWIHDVFRKLRDVGRFCDARKAIEIRVGYPPEYTPGERSRFPDQGLRAFAPLRICT